MKKVLFSVGCAALLVACDGAARMSPVAPTAVVPVVPVATAPPLPPPDRFQQPYTELIIGSAVQRKVDQSTNPECEGLPGYGCQYFRITPERDGMLDVELNWVLETQPGQTLDLSYETATGQLWASYFPPTKGRFMAQVKAGETSQITVWYTFPGVEFTLQTALGPH